MKNCNYIKPQPISNATSASLFGLIADFILARMIGRRGEEGGKGAAVSSGLYPNR
jgi:hypothetical protein